jgi:hypothetical protein
LEIHEDLSQIYECRNWETEHYNSVLAITVSFLGIHKWEADIYIGFSPALRQCMGGSFVTVNIGGLGRSYCCKWRGWCIGLSFETVNLKAAEGHIVVKGNVSTWG